MQGPIADPRGKLSTSDVYGLLTSDSTVNIEQGAYHLDQNFVNIGELTPYMQPGCSVTFDNTAQIQATCTIALDSSAPFNNITDFVQPFMRFSNDKGVTAEFRLGVYTLQSPPYDISTNLGVQTFSGYDLNYLLTTPMPDSFAVYYGQNYIAQIVELISQALPNVRVNYVDNMTTVTNPNSWAIGGDGGGEAATYADVINQMLSTIGYENVWFDWDGNARLTPHTPAAQRPVEYTFDVSSTNNVVAEQRTVEQDLFSVPNQWIFVMADLQSVPIEGQSQYTFTDMDATHPGSVFNRKRVYSVVNFVTAADYDSLVALAKMQIASDLNPAETYTFSTFPFPLAWWSDIIAVDDPNLVQVPPLNQATRKMSVQSWSLPLDGSGDMTWTATTATVN